MLREKPLVAAVREIKVPILTRPVGRMLRNGQRGVSHAGSSNPHPARRPDAAVLQHPELLATNTVPILTRPVGRMLPIPSLLADAYSPKFQSSPGP